MRVENLHLSTLPTTTIENTLETRYQGEKPTTHVSVNENRIRTVVDEPIAMPPLL